MTAAGHRSHRPYSALALWLVAFALLARVLVPAGWMPSVENGKGYAITLCTGMGAMSAWVDGDGNVHKQKPASDGRADQPCAFAGFAAAFALPDMLGPTALFVPIATATLLTPLADGAVGRGLAAPPPPPTGPPAIL